MSSTLAEVKFASLRSCFANLPTHLVRALGNTNAIVQDVIIEIQYAQPNRSSQSGKSADSRSAFLGWTGMASTSISSARPRGSVSQRQIESPVIEVDATFGHVLGLADGQQVNVFVHLNPPLAHTVNIEPLTAADWEIIELHAAFLESNLLFQVRAIPNPAYAASPVAKTKQMHPLTIHLSPTSTANVLVTGIMPPQASSVPCIKIAPDAEVIVAPKLRPSQAFHERAASRSIVSKNSISGRSRGGHRSAQAQIAIPKTAFVRAVDKGVAPKFFESDQDPLNRKADAALAVWVDQDFLYDSGFRKSEYVSVSVQGLRSMYTTTDANSSEKIAALEESGAGRPVATVIAKLETWEDAPDMRHAALSPQLCSCLDISGCVGQMIRLAVAPPKCAKNKVGGLNIYPFASSSEKVEGLKIKGTDNTTGKQALETLRTIYTGNDSQLSLFDGPLTDGQLLPAVGDSSWAGGILRFKADDSESSESSDTSRWTMGSEMKNNLSLQQEVPNPIPSKNTFTDESVLSRDPPVLVGVRRLIEQAYGAVLEGSSVLVTGGKGAGKSGLCAKLAHTVRSEDLVHVSFVQCIRLKSDEIRVSQVQETISQTLQKAALGSKLGGRALIIFDDLDQLCPAETELQTGDNVRSRQISESFTSQIRRYLAENARISILATAQHKDSAHRTIVGGNIFTDVVPIKAPDKDGRRRVLQALATPETRSGNDPSDRGEDRTNEEDAEAIWMNGEDASSAVADPRSEASNLDFLDVAGQTDGYMAGDLVQLVSRAKNEAIIRTIAEETGDTSLTLTQPDFTNALKGYTPASLRNVTLQTSQTTFSSIGGLQQTRQTLLETLQYPTTYAPIFAQCPLRLRSGLLLYGYPGCGKTMLASAVAGECGLNFISVKGPEILNKYIGASEKAVRDLFERAESAKPCVLFFDEFDSIAPKRGHDSTGVTDRVVNQLLTQMDGAEGLSGVYVLAATSRPDLIDPALLRPGRLDKSLLCDMPTSEDRLDILKALAKNLKIEGGVLSEKSGRRSLGEVAEMTAGYTGADLQALIYNAHLEAVHESLGDLEGEDGDRKQKSNGVKKGKLAGRLDIIQFRLGQTQYSDGTIPKTRAQEVAEYAAIVSRLDELKLAKKKEKQDKRSGGHDEDTNAMVNGTSKASASEVTIEWRHIEGSLGSTRSSISETERRRLRGIYHEFVVGRNGEMPDGQGGNEIGGRSSLM